MTLGSILNLCGLISGSAAVVFLIREATARGTALRQRSPALLLYRIMTGFVILESAVLMYLILTHQFAYDYVARYSSTDLPVLYLISSFWAGQEGTFLLWSLMVAVMGLVFLRNTRRGDPLALAMASAYVVFLLVILVVKDPFSRLAVVPPDGAGMNPLLQDPWMVIHPPILFCGYAAAIFPFALAVSALYRKRFEQWFTLGFGWTLFASLTLGAGIIIGGFWAYEVLGWGGYWGWDPVENSSLVPWLTLLALIHGLVVQKSRGGLVRTNIFLAILSFLLVTYATFLTRSGVLADFSVHSFVDLGINNLLIGIMVVYAVTGLVPFVTGFRGIVAPKIDASGINRELTLLLSIYVLGIAALFTFVGMSSPILTGLAGKASQVDTSFYNKVNMPVAILMSLLLGITPFLSWKEEFGVPLLKRYSIPLILTVLAVVISLVAGVSEILQLLFVGSAAFALISNAIVTVRQYRSGWLNIGGPLAHIGVALLMIGIIGSGSFDTSSKTILRQGEPTTVFGYQFTFSGPIDRQGLKPVMAIEVSDGRKSWTAQPKLYFSDYNKAMMREPDIRIFPLHDLYISPLELRSGVGSDGNPSYTLTQGVPQMVGPWRITFNRFETGQHGNPGEMAVGAELSVESGGSPVTVIPMLSLTPRGEYSATPVALPPASGMPEGSQIAMTAMNVEGKQVKLQIVRGQELVVDISTKPLMMVVWTGVVLILAGTVISWRRRTRPSEA